MPVSASTFNIPLEALADRTAWLKARLLGERNVPLVSVFSSGFAFTVAGGPGSNAYGYAQSSTTTPLVTIPIHIPQPGTAEIKIIQARVRYRAATGHGALPAIKPAIHVDAQGASGGAIVQLGLVFDAPADVTAYESASGRDLILTLNNTLTTSDSYYLTFQGESGANSLTGLLLTLVSVTYDLV